VITVLGLILISLILVGLFHNAKAIEVTPDSKIVIITHDGIKQIVPTNDKNVGDLLKRLNITIKSGDVVQPSLTTPINQDDFRVNIYRALPVAIKENGSITFTYSAATTPRAIAAQAGVVVYAADYVKGTPDQDIVAGAAIGKEVVINPATPINLNLYGTSLVVRTHAQTVADLVKQENIHLAATDQVIPAANTELTANLPVFIVRKGVEIQNVTQAIAMPVQTIEDPNLAYGTSSVVQQGSPGQETITYQDNTSNGKVVSQSIIQTVVTTPAVTEIVDEGTSLSGIQGDMALAGISPSDYNYVDYIVSHESGWCPTKAQGEHYCPVLPDNQFTSAGYGLCQATPGIKMESFGADWATDPITQLHWCNNYAETKYGGWAGAYAHWIAYSWW
jgi:uncharacterized protein YabE (DUF348 family)